MYKLLVADDEKLEREALKYIISKSIDSIIDISEAANGREAIIKAQSTNPDIIILDIHMPGINGLEAAWKIRESNPDVAIIFLTAFHEFDYAHEAIKIGVDDYIIKPSPEKTIIEVVNNVIKKIKHRIENKINQDNIEMRLDKATDYLCSEFTYNLATRSISEEKFRNYLTLMDTGFYYGRGVIIKLNFESYPIKVESDFQKQILKKRSIRLINNVLKKNSIISTSNYELNNIYLFIYSEDINIKIEDINQFNSILNSIKESIKEILNIEIILGYGSLINEARCCMQSFSEAKMFNTGKVNIKEQIPIELEISLEQSIISADKNITEGIIKELEQWLLLSPALFKTKKRSIKDLTAVLKHSVASLFPDCKDCFNIDDINNSETLEELISSIKTFVNSLIESIVILYKKENIPAIKKACDYIYENYHKDITLEDAANNSNLSSFYFSKIFKEEKKQNFINFLTEVRINKAKQLLTNTTLNIKEITSAIGYKDPNYFTRVFKKETSCSPSDFRNNKMLKRQ